MATGASLDEGITVEDNSIIPHSKYIAGDIGEDISDEEGIYSFYNCILGVNFFFV